MKNNVVCLHKFKIDKILKSSHNIINELRFKWQAYYISNGHEFDIKYGDQMERDYYEVELLSLGYNDREVRMVFKKVGLC